MNVQPLPRTPPNQTLELPDIATGIQSTPYSKGVASCSSHLNDLKYARPSRGWNARSYIVLHRKATGGSQVARRRYSKDCQRLGLDHVDHVYSPNHALRLEREP